MITANILLYKSCLQRIADALMINGGFLDNPGLYSGEIGVALFFFQYDRFTQNELYMEYGYELIERIQGSIHAKTPVDYKTGITGIGAAIEYLAQNGYVEADTDEILEDFDSRIFSGQHVSQLSEEEIKGVAYYAIWRIAGSPLKRGHILNALLPKIIKVIERRHSGHEKSHSALPFLKSIAAKTTSVNHLYNKDLPCHSCLPDDVEKILNKDLNKLELGVENGLAGMGLSLITELTGDSSWTSLFPDDYIQTVNSCLYN